MTIRRLDGTLVKVKNIAIDVEAREQGGENDEGS
jgi:hypothetical protein